MEIEAERYRDEAKHAIHELDALRGPHAEMAKDLDRLRKSANQAEAEKNAALAREAALLKELEINKNAFEQERHALHEQIRSLNGRADEIEARIREELGSQMRRIIAEAADEAQQERARLLAQQAEEFARQSNAFRERISALEEERDHLKRLLAEAEAEGRNFQNQRQNYEAKIQALENETGFLKGALKDAETKFQKDIAAKNAELRDLGEKMGRLEDERNALYGLGQALLNGLDEFESHVAGEENRMGINPAEFRSPRKAAPAKVVTPKMKTPKNTPVVAAAAKKLHSPATPQVVELETPTRHGKRRRVE